MSLYHVYARLTPAAPDRLVLRIIALAFCLVLSFLLFPVRTSAPLDEDGTRLGRGRRRAHHDPVDRSGAGRPLARLSQPISSSTTATSPALPHRASAQPRRHRGGHRVVVLVLEATRRTLGLALPILALCSSPTALAGPWLPGPLRHKGLTYEILIDQTFFTTEGLFGIPLGVAASYVILFIIFGAFLEKSGAGQFFMNLANALAGGQRGGPGKVAVVSSSLFGTISGSAVANVMVDGWLTIPDDEAHRLQAGGGRRGRGRGLHRRADHAAGDGRRVVRDGRVPRRALLAHHDRRRDPGHLLLRRALRGHPLQRLAEGLAGIPQARAAAAAACSCAPGASPGAGAGDLLPAAEGFTATYAAIIVRTRRSVVWWRLCGDPAASTPRASRPVAGGGHARPARSDGRASGPDGAGGDGHGHRRHHDRHHPADRHGDPLHELSGGVRRRLTCSSPWSSR